MLQPAAPSVAGETALLAALREEQWQTTDLLLARLAIVSMAIEYSHSKYSHSKYSHSKYSHSKYDL